MKVAFVSLKYRAKSISIFLSIIVSERWSQEWEWKGWDKKDKEKSTHTRFEDKDDVLAMKWSRMCGANGCVGI